MELSPGMQVPGSRKRCFANTVFDASGSRESPKKKLKGERRRQEIRSGTQFTPLLPSAPPLHVFDEDTKNIVSLSERLDLYPHCNPEEKSLTSRDKLTKLQEFVHKNEIPFYLSEHLNKLSGRDIIFIVDDSGSMGIELKNHSIPKKEARSIKAKTGLTVIRRWDELKYYLEVAVELAQCFDENGVDLIGLNRPHAKNVNNVATVRRYFKGDPDGSTPLYTRLKEVLDNHKDGSKKVIVIATDGVPNDRSLNDFRQLVDTRAGRRAEETPIVFMKCTDDSEDVDYLESLDACPFVGIVDDFRSEKKQIRDPDKRRQYTPGGHTVNVLLNWIPQIDSLDDDVNSSGLSRKLAKYGDGLLGYCSTM
mmetsp:Transcript_7043/g.9658  ORF Transcript_7043/g.9658 Transcript_7043/m.9658 type:complete len:364 (-) Transcript_7043:122-1213(-)